MPSLPLALPSVPLRPLAIALGVWGLLYAASNADDHWRGQTSTSTRGHREVVHRPERGSSTIDEERFQGLMLYHWLGAGGLVTLAWILWNWDRRWRRQDLLSPENTLDPDQYH